MASFIASNYGNLSGSLGTTQGLKVARRSGSGNYYYKVDVQLNSQDKTALTSNITVRFYIYPTFPSDGTNALNWGSFTPTSNSQRMSLKVAGVERVPTAARRITLKGVTNNLVFSWTGNVSHNASTGALSVPIEATFGGTEANYFPNITTAYLTAALPTIGLDPLVYTKVNDAWKSGKVYIKQNDTWVKASKVLVKVNDTWKEVAAKG